MTRQDFNETIGRTLGWTPSDWWAGGVKDGVRLWFRNFRETHYSEPEYLPDFAGTLVEAATLIKAIERSSKW